ncbi:hypothetical protein [Deinococcus humi]|uniref:Uncharacterized protein n=1 Tax=Deinococcus humi TaxID=662880 RepID=A0A7W8JZ57_9DEIO|nr:hypothetical protein [Deinococcus humi]MBB5364608.1 hypothetical protein [Deinococcus humi]GGO39202.1 hypothetical protein GCM10008949_46930 [Deinococcus humi]
MSNQNSAAIPPAQLSPAHKEPYERPSLTALGAWSVVTLQQSVPITILPSVTSWLKGRDS